METDREDRAEQKGGVRMGHNAFSGWRTVFRFTWVQSLKTTKIKRATILLGAVLFVGAMILNIALSLSQGPSPIQNLYWVNESDLTGDFSELNRNARFSHVNIYEETATREELLERLAGTDYDVAVFLGLEDDVYHIEAVLPKGSRISRREAQALTEALRPLAEEYRLQKANVGEQIAAIAKVKGQVQIIEVGGAVKGAGELWMQILLPMIVGAALYAMIMLYGQTIAKTIIAEKTSKLMETLLTYIQPHALIAGKIGAMVSLALAQMGIWILCVLLGLWVGDLIGDILNPNYVNGMMEALRQLRQNGGLSALSPAGVILSLLALCLGFLLYSVIAGFLNSFASKPEDLSNTMGVFIAVSIVSWLLAYVLPVYTLLQGGNVSGILNFIPFTAAFCLPADILVGRISMGGAMVALALMVLMTILFIFLAGKIYKTKVFYRGASPFGIITKNR